MGKVSYGNGGTQWLAPSQWWCKLWWSVPVGLAMWALVGWYGYGFDYGPCCCWASFVSASFLCWVLQLSKEFCELLINLSINSLPKSARLASKDLDWYFWISAICWTEIIDIIWSKSVIYSSKDSYQSLPLL